MLPRTLPGPILLALAVLLNLAAATTAPAELPPAVSLDDLMVFDEHGARIGLVEALSPGMNLIVFWQPGSRPSREAVIHVFQNLDLLDERGVVPLGISVSEPSSGEVFLQSQGVRFENVYDPGGRAAPRFGMAAVYPSLLLLDGAGCIIGTSEGGGDSFGANLTRLLERADRPKPADVHRNWAVGIVLAALAIIGMALSR